MDVSYLVNFDKQSALEEQTSLIVLGSGVAGLYTAYKAAKLGSDVVIITKNWQESNTRYAQGGIAAVLDQINDSYNDHIRDTIEAGKGLCNEEAVEIMVKEGPALVDELMAIGTHFDKENGEIHLTKEGGHSHRRVLHSDGDQTGREIARSLQDAVMDNPRIKIVTGFAIDLLVDKDRCVGVLCEVEDSLIIYRSKATVIATGGLGQIYLNTTNPEVSTGDGLAMAYRAGAKMMNMGLVQFHPTALAYKGMPKFLISEAVRGEGAVLVNKNGTRFMEEIYARAELEPRDIVAKAIVKEIESTKCNAVYLDIKRLRDKGINFSERFPFISKTLSDYGIDHEEGLIPVAPAAHYLMGGIAVDLNGRTSLKGLYASGEAACASLHGANRLASNSLLDGLVFSNRIALDFIAKYNDNVIEDLNIEYIISRVERDYKYKDIRRIIKETMWNSVGLIRSKESLENALTELGYCAPYLWQEHHTIEDYETVNMLNAAILVTRSALWRKESRGSHYREDYPRAYPKYKEPDVIRR